VGPSDAAFAASGAAALFDGAVEVGAAEATAALAAGSDAFAFARVSAAAGGVAEVPSAEWRGGATLPRLLVPNQSLAPATMLFVASGNA
jgi:hypothetical protein